MHLLLLHFGSNNKYGIMDLKNGEKYQNIKPFLLWNLTYLVMLILYQN